MKRIFLSLSLSIALLITPFGSAQTPDANQEQKLLALIKEVQTQQAQMAENQAKIETKLADVSETIRVARILAGKIGK
jgi:endonuclease III